MERESDLKLNILFPLVQYLTVHHGREALSRAAELAEVDCDELIRGKQWVATEQAEAFCHYVDELLQGDEAEFRKACAFQLHKAYGPLRYILWALSPLLVLRQAAANMHLVSSCGRYQLEETQKGRLKVRYTSTRDEGRHLCLLRQTNITCMPTFWGLPSARLQEHACISRGDESCSYEVRWTEPARRWPLLVGLGIGGVLGAGLLTAGTASTWVAPTLLALCGGALGQVFELRRASRHSLEFAQESHGALERLAHEEAEARRQLGALSQRQQEWSRLMESQLAQRTSALEKVIETVEQAQRERVTVLRGMSHDLRSPLTVLHSVAEYARLKGLAASDSLIDDQLAAVERMDHLLRELMDVAVDKAGAPRRAPELIDVRALTSHLRGQLRALVFGKDIRVSVFCSREAPTEISADKLLFARVLDNLLSNAAKYTERGSIVVELDGQREFISIKISDSGRGIPEDQLDRVFQPDHSAEAARAPASYGVGLSVVVRLLAEVGGRLDVLSKEGVGTTFWVFFPIAPRTAQAEESPPPEGERLEGVVRIRRHVAGD